MTDEGDKEQTGELVQEHDIDAPPETVWQALSSDELRERWLPDHAEEIDAVPGETIRFRLTDDEPPFLESTVTFELRPGADGGTRLRIVHRLTDARIEETPPMAANSNTPRLMRAA